MSTSIPVYKRFAGIRASLCVLFSLFCAPFACFSATSALSLRSLCALLARPSAPLLHSLFPLHYFFIRGVVYMYTSILVYKQFASICASLCALFFLFCAPFLPLSRHFCTPFFLHYFFIHEAVYMYTRILVYKHFAGICASPCAHFSLFCAPFACFSSTSALPFSLIIFLTAGLYTCIQVYQYTSSLLEYARPFVLLFLFFVLISRALAPLLHSLCTLFALFSRPFLSFLCVMIYQKIVFLRCRARGVTFTK